MDSVMASTCAGELPVQMMKNRQMVPSIATLFFLYGFCDNFYKLHI